MIRNDIQPKLENIEEYFSKLEFYIPSYQRPYAWGVEQCEQLIEDINSHKDNFDKDTQDNYFFGAILISQDPEDNHEVTLIDGQQRTTTFMLLLKAILMKISKEISMLSEESREDKKLYSRLKNLKSEITSITNTQIRDFAEHFIKYCQVITITSYNTDQAINIFNALNGTGVPLSPIEVIVSKITALSKDRSTFEENWKQIVSKTDASQLDLNLLITHYIFISLSNQNGVDKRNPGIKNFFNKNKHLLTNDLQFTDDLNQILDNFAVFNETELGKIFTVFNGNLKPFVSSYYFYRNDSRYIMYLLKLGALLEITDYSYSHKLFKGFLEDINLKYSQVDKYSDQKLIDDIQEHIKAHFNRDIVEELLNESGVSKPLIYLNEYLYSKENNLEFTYSEHVDIEHIMPVSGINRENIMKDAECSSTEEFYEYAEKLGNKILLESEINRGIGDAWFRTKKENTITSGHGYKGSKYHLAQSLVNYPKSTWNKEDIDVATALAATRITNFIFNE